MKKTIVCILVVTMLLGLAACGTKQETARYEGTMTGLLQAIYEKASPEFAVMEPTEVDLADSNALSYYTGLTDGTLLTEAAFSEPMMSSQAYSLVAMRVAEGGDAKAVAQQVVDGVDASKWICVTADDVRAVVYGDVVLLLMVGSSLSDTLGDGLVSAFSETVGGEPEATLTK